MTQQESPPWYVPGDPPATIRNGAHHEGVSSKDIASTLAAQEFDAPSERIVQLVETTRDRLPLHEEASRGHELEEPRPVPGRIVGVEDVPYLNRRDFALLLGTALIRYDGHFRKPDEPEDVAIDLIWNRQHTTSVFVTLPRALGVPVEREDIKEVVDGETHPDYIRSPSVVGIVSSGQFSKEAQRLAESNDLDFFGPAYIDTWLKDANLPFDVAGQVLERGTMTSEEIGGLLEQLEPLPQHRQENEPLGEVRSLADRSIEDELSASTNDGQIELQPEGSEAAGAEGDPEESSSSVESDDQGTEKGKFGELYADSDEDRDQDAFDRFVDELGDSQ